MLTQGTLRILSSRKASDICGRVALARPSLLLLSQSRPYFSATPFLRVTFDPSALTGSAIHRYGWGRFLAPVDRIPRVLQTLLPLFFFSKAIIFGRGHLALAILGHYHILRNHLNRNPVKTENGRLFDETVWERSPRAVKR